MEKVWAISSLVSWFKMKSKSTPEKLATELRRIVYPERCAEILKRNPFKGALKVVGEERLLDEVAWLLFFAVDAGLRAGLVGHRELNVVRLHLFDTLRAEFGSTNFETIKARNTEYQEAIKDAPVDFACVGRRFADFCGIEENSGVALAVALGATILFKSTADLATEVAQKYKLSG